MSALTIAPPRRAARGAARAQGWLRRHPFSSGLAALYLLVAVVFGGTAGPDALLRERLWVTLGAGRPFAHWWAPMTGALFAGDLPELGLAVVGSIVLLGGAEHLMGWRRTALAFTVTAVVGTLAGAGLILLGELGGVPWARSIARIATVDPQSGIFGAVAAASAFAGVLWRRRIRFMTILAALVFVLYSGEPADIYRLTATAAGLGLGMLLRTRRRKAAWTRSSQHEKRMLLATATALTALGPAIALFSRTRVGPLGPIGMLLAAPTGPSVASDPGLSDRCSLFRLGSGCVGQLALARITGPGEIVVSVAPLLVLLLAAWGLLHGRRFAVWLAAGVEAFLGVLGAVFFGIVPARVAGPLVGGTYHDVQFQVDAVLSILLPLAVAAALIAGRRNFLVRSGVKTAVAYPVLLALALVALGAVYVIALGHARLVGVPATPGRLAEAAIERFVPVAFLGDARVAVVPVSPVARVLAHAVGPAFWCVVAVGAVRPLFGGGTSRAPQGDAARARALAEVGGDTLSFMTTWPGNEYWFSPDGRAAVAYRVVGRVALTTGGPVGEASDSRALIEQFARYCDDSGWIPVFYSVEPGLARSFHALGWHARTVAEEAVLNPLEIELTGRKWQKVRSAVNKARREGLTAMWCQWRELPLQLSNQLIELSEEWVAGKELPEMGFTLGGLPEARDPAVRLMIALDASGRVQAFTSWLPVYRAGVVVGYTNDLMRRRLGGMHGAMEFVIASVIERLRADGIGVLSLSAAPLARSTTGDGDGLDQLLERLSERLEPVYGFRSLLSFKRKFQPELRPLLIAYHDAVALPAIGIALVRAYLPSLSLRQASGLVRGLARVAEADPGTGTGTGTGTSPGPTRVAPHSPPASRLR